MPYTEVDHQVSPSNPHSNSSSTYNLASITQLISVLFLFFNKGLSSPPQATYATLTPQYTCQSQKATYSYCGGGSNSSISATFMIEDGLTKP